MGRYFPFVFLMSGNNSIHFSGGRMRTLPGRMLCSNQGTCCKPAAAHSIFRWLLQGRDGKIRQGTFYPFPTNLWRTLIQCIWELSPIHANDFDLIAFIPTLTSCERSKVQNIGELWLWLQAHLRSWTSLFFKLHLRSEKGSCPLVSQKKKPTFLFDAKIKAFSKALWCARQTCRQILEEEEVLSSAITSTLFESYSPDIIFMWSR